MNGIYTFIYKIFSYPFGYIIDFLYNLFGGNYLLAVIMLAVLVKIVLLPTAISTQKGQAKSQRMRSRIEKIKEKYKDDQNKQNEAIQEFYKKEGFSSMGSGCGSMLIQFPVIIGLYGAIYYPLTYVLRIDKRFGNGIIEKLTSAAESMNLGSSSGSATRFMENTVISKIDELKEVCLSLTNGQTVYNTIHDFNANFQIGAFSFGDMPKQFIADGGTKAVLIIPILAFAAAMISSIYSLIRTRKMNDSNAANMASMGCMMLFMPFFSLWLAYQFPVGIGIYWAVNSLLGFLQMLVLDLIYKPDKVIARNMVEETILRKSKEAAVKELH